MLDLTTKSILAAGVLALAATVTCIAPAAQAAVPSDPRDQAAAAADEMRALVSGVRGGLTNDVRTAPHDDSGDGGDTDDTDDGGDDSD
jgi:hypothetical protein